MKAQNEFVEFKATFQMGKGQYKRKKDDSSQTPSFMPYSAALNIMNVSYETQKEKDKKFKSSQTPLFMPYSTTLNIMNVSYGGNTKGKICFVLCL